MKKLMLATLAIASLALPVLAAEPNLIEDHNVAYSYDKNLKMWFRSATRSYGNNSAWGAHIPESEIPPEFLKKLKAQAGIE